jgi:hypothetical protein
VGELLSSLIDVQFIKKVTALSARSNTVFENYFNSKAITNGQISARAILHSAVESHFLAHFRAIVGTSTGEWYLVY